jgi:Uncharacterized protein conserved in bacteria (DUF2213)
LLRLGSELKKALPTFKRKPVLSRHEPIDADHPRQDLVIGTTGSDAKYDERTRTVLNTITLWQNADGIDEVKSGAKKALSCGYSYKANMQPFVWKGQHVDGWMSDIALNHVTICEVPRVPGIIIGDSKKGEFGMSTFNGGNWFGAGFESGRRYAHDADLPPGMTEGRSRAKEEPDMLASRDQDPEGNSFSPEEIKAFIKKYMDPRAYAELCRMMGSEPDDGEGGGEGGAPSWAETTRGRAQDNPPPFRGMRQTGGRKWRGGGQDSGPSYFDMFPENAKVNANGYGSSTQTIDDVLRLRRR